MTIARALILVTGAALFAGGCVHRIHIPYDPDPDPAPAPRTVAAVPGPFDYETAPVPFKNRVLDDEESDRHRVRYLRIPSSGNNRQPDQLVTGRYYQLKSPGPRGLVIVLPIWGSSTYPPDKITRRLLANSDHPLNILQIDGANRLIDYETLVAATDEEAFARALLSSTDSVRAAVVDTRRLLDWAEARPEIDPERIGIVGFSISAIVAVLAYQHDPRPAAVVPVMGTARVADAIVTCPGRLQQVREAIVPRFGWSLEHYTEGDP